MLPNYSDLPIAFAEREREKERERERERERQTEGGALPCGQSYKQFTLINYDPRVVVISKLLIFTTLDS